MARASSARAHHNLLDIAPVKPQHLVPLTSKMTWLKGPKVDHLSILPNIYPQVCHYFILFSKLYLSIRVHCACPAPLRCWPSFVWIDFAILWLSANNFAVLRCRIRFPPQLKGSSIKDVGTWNGANDILGKWARSQHFLNICWLIITVKMLTKWWWGLDKKVGKSTRCLLWTLPKGKKMSHPLKLATS